MSEKGWDATGKIRPIWQQLDGKDKRGQLATASGVRETELSSHNNGKRLGPEVADKIIAGAASLGVAVSRLELGAPAGEVTDGRSKTFLDHLQAIEEQVAENAETIRDLTDELKKLAERLGSLELRQDTRRRARGDQ